MMCRLSRWDRTRRKTLRHSRVGLVLHQATHAEPIAQHATIMLSMTLGWAKRDCTGPRGPCAPRGLERAGRASFRTACRSRVGEIKLHACAALEMIVNEQWNTDMFT